MYLLVSSKSAIFPSQESPSLTRVKKRYQHMPPQFRSNRSVAPKLLLIITANAQIYLNLPIRRYIESPFCPRAKVINISIFFSAGTSPVAPLLPSLFKNTLALPPPLQLPRVSRIQVQELPLRQWLPSPRSQRYVFSLLLHFCPPFFFRSLQSHFLFPPLFFRILGVTQLSH